MQVQSLKDLMAEAAQFAARTFKTDGYVSPLWVCQNEDGDKVLIATPWANGEDKAAVLSNLPLLFEAQGIVRFVFLGEGWTVESAEGIRDVQEHGTLPSESEDRREILFLVGGERHSGKAMHGKSYILRPEHGPAVLSPMDLRDCDARDVQGALSAMFVADQAQSATRH